MRFRLVLFLFSVIQIANCSISRQLQATTTDLVNSVEKFISLSLYNVTSSGTLTDYKEVYENLNQWENVKNELFDLNNYYKKNLLMKKMLIQLFKLKENMINHTKIDQASLHTQFPDILSSFQRALNRIHNVVQEGKEKSKCIPSQLSPFDQNQSEEKYLASVKLLAKYIEKTHDDSFSKSDVSKQTRLLEALALIFALHAVVTDMCALITIPVCLVFLMIADTTIVVWVAWLYRDLLSPIPPANCI